MDHLQLLFLLGHHNMELLLDIEGAVFRMEKIKFPETNSLPTRPKKRYDCVYIDNHLYDYIYLQSHFKDLNTVCNLFTIHHINIFKPCSVSYVSLQHIVLIKINIFECLFKWRLIYATLLNRVSFSGTFIPMI